MASSVLADNASRPLADIMPAGLLGMALQGGATALYGPILPYIAAEAGQPVANAGLLITLHWLGFLLSTAVVNGLARRFGFRRGLMTGGALIGMGVLGIAGLPFPANLGAALPIGFGAGLIEVLFNRLVEGLAGDQPAAALNRLHSTWGLGAVAIPLAVAGALTAGLDWRLAGLLLAAVAAGEVLLIGQWRRAYAEADPPPAGPALPAGAVWRSVGLLLLMFVVYAGLETAVGGWVTTYFTGLGQGSAWGAVATAFFFLTFTAGRLILAPFVDRLGFARTVRLGTGLGAVALLLTLSPSLAFFGFGLSGITYSVIFPTMLAWGARQHPTLRAQMASWSIAAAGLGGTALPYLMGWGVERGGLSALPVMLIATSLLILSLSFFKPASA
ncbi:MAG: hypothetical protein KA764_02315 [Anaerolineales bacterium]|nr:hypothetical protein [Anaerolineales bacterium]